MTTEERLAALEAQIGELQMEHNAVAVMFEAGIEEGWRRERETARFAADRAALAAQVLRAPRAPRRPRHLGVVREVAR